MGQDKAEVLVGSSTMLDRVGEALSRVVGDVVVLGPIRDGWRCLPDSIHAPGPLAGIATGLTRLATDQVLVVAVDHPFVRSETLGRLAGLADEVPVVPVNDHGVRQVTCAVYPTSIAGAALEEAAAGGSIQTLLDRVSFNAVTPETWKTWGEDGRSWYSADSPSTLDEGIARFGED